MTKPKFNLRKPSGPDTSDPIPTLACERNTCRRLVAYKDGGYRIYIKHNSDYRRGSVGWFMCNKCVDELAVWLGEYDAEEATGRGPTIADSGTVQGSSGESKVFRG